MRKKKIEIGDNEEEAAAAIAIAERTHRSVKSMEGQEEANSNRKTHPMHTAKFAN